MAKVGHSGPMVARLICTLGFLFAVLSAWADSVSFNRDIRPILSNNCYACHRFDRNKRKADLRLDTREGAIANVIDTDSSPPPRMKTDDERLVRIVTDVGAVFRFEAVDEIGRWELAGNLDIIKTDPAPTTG
ncbi:MAG: hypothetical protein GWQ05_06250 [Verrucomicrobiaceae bacterium]|nr:hypothetical protein [Verrucomicrobiaceae bacterium]NCF90549.1 hypothetical protein [Verrucomicrobiaceae bacterium]